jgi:hypothetical protein
VELTVDAIPSCHSSAPPAESSIGILAAAVSRQGKACGLWRLAVCAESHQSVGVLASGRWSFGEHAEVRYSAPVPSLCAGRA